MSPTDGGHHHVPLTPKNKSSPSSKKVTPTLVGGCRRVTPNSKSSSMRKTPATAGGRSTKSPSPPRKLPVNVAAAAAAEDKDVGSTVEQQPESSFQDHKELCDRVAKSLYFANKLPTTPRPSLPLTKLAVSTFSKAARTDTLEYLDLERAAEIGRNACISPTALIMAIVYLERLSASNPGYLGSVKPSDLFVVSLLVASKFIQDDGEELGIFNDEFATSANLDLKEINRLEIQFLTAIDWRVKVDPDEYDKVLVWLEKEVAIEEGTDRGWFSYSEVTTLLSFHLLWPIYQHYVKVITATILTYTTLLATLVTSPQIFMMSFMMSKTYLTALTATTTGSTINYQQPYHTNCANNSNSMETFRNTHQCFGNGLLQPLQDPDTDNNNMMNLDLDLDGEQISISSWALVDQLLFNGTDSANNGNMIAHLSRNQKWARPGHDPVLNHLHHPAKYNNNGLNPESLASFTRELQRLFQNVEQHQKYKTDPTAFTGKCYPKASYNNRCGAEETTYSKFKNDRFSSLRHGLPAYIK